MDYFLIYQGKAIGRTDAETSPFSLKKCEQLRKREVKWIRLGDLKADMCFGVIEGGKKTSNEQQTA